MLEAESQRLHPRPFDYLHCFIYVSLLLRWNRDRDIQFLSYAGCLVWKSWIHSSSILEKRGNEFTADLTASHTGWELDSLSRIMTWFVLLY